jgi:hypothetical protein
MKSGTGTNPFENDEGSEADTESGAADQPQQETNGSAETDHSAPAANSTQKQDTHDKHNSQPAAPSSTVDIDSDESSDETPDTVSDGIDPSSLAADFVPTDYQHKHNELDIKWALGRENVKKSRSMNRMFRLQDRIDDLEQEVKRELLDDDNVTDIHVTDLREAALILAYNQPDLLAELLDEWGARHI